MCTTDGASTAPAIASSFPRSLPMDRRYVFDLFDSLVVVVVGLEFIVISV